VTFTVRGGVSFFEVAVDLAIIRGKSVNTSILRVVQVCVGGVIVNFRPHTRLPSAMAAPWISRQGPSESLCGWMRPWIIRLRWSPSAHSY
jgi:hypothetical protein